MPADTIPARLFRRADETPAAVAYAVKTDDGWVKTSWGTYSREVRQAAKALIALGIGEGDITTILGFNRPEWVILDMATMCVGGAPAGIYTTSSPEEVQYIVSHSESPLILVEDADQLAKVQKVRDQLPALQHIVMMQGSDAPEGVLSWDAFLAKGDGVDDAEIDNRVAALEPDQMATLIYTSGTTGPPKAVILTHDNLIFTSDGAMEIVPGLSSDDRLVSYLPLSHIAEQMFSIHNATTGGYAIYFAESIEKLAENLVEVKPTVFFAVPRVWEKFQAGIQAKLSEATGVKAKLAAWAQKVGKQYVLATNEGKDPGAAVKAQFAIADKIVLSKVRAAVGLDECNLAATAAAPIAPEVLEFFAGFGLPIVEIYGQSEGCGPTTSNRMGANKIGTVGTAFPGCEVKIAEDGEILLKGRNVFAGYLKNPEATAETIVDGWLHSGDLGEFDEDGYLTITGRKKDIIITAGGKNIAPKNLEAGLKNCVLISEAVVIGDRRKYLTALVTLDPEAAARFCEEHDISEAPHSAEQVRKEIQSAVDELNATLARVEQIKKFTILDRELSIEDGELTGTLKVKRNVVNDNWADVIDSMYV